MTQKIATIKSSYLLMLLALMVTGACHLSAMEERERKNSDESEAESTALHSKRERERASKKERERRLPAGDRGASMTVIEQEEDVSSSTLPEESATATSRATHHNSPDASVPLSLAAFRAALDQAPPGASRFVLKKAPDGTSSLIAEEGDAATPPQHLRGENREATGSFQAALEAEAPGVAVEDLFGVNSKSTLESYPALSAEKMRTALERVDQQESPFLSRVRNRLEKKSKEEAVVARLRAELEEMDRKKAAGGSSQGAS